MLDEIQTGMGRTGRWFAYQRFDWLPDVISVAKGLANGVPIGACLARGAAADLFQPGNHGSTFGGNPLACAAGLAVIRTLEEQQLDQRAERLGQWMLTRLRRELRGVDTVSDIRGTGLMIGIEMNYPCTRLAEDGLKRRVLFSVQSERVIRLLPPLVITETEADEIVDRVAATVRADAANAQKRKTA